MGGLFFYGRENAEKRGERYSYHRYTSEAAANGDPFALRLDSTPTLKALYLDAEEDTNYLRDRNVFGENITAEDTMSVTARYENGVLLTYSLIAYSPWEGYRVAVTGDKGRLEVDLVEQVGKPAAKPGVKATEADPRIVAKFGGKHIWVFPMFGRPYEVEIPVGVGGHGGGDSVMLEQIFAGQPPPDPYARAASHVDGAASILLGIAANESIASGRPIRVSELLALPKQ
jgi:predicted dehydrogenase